MLRIYIKYILHIPTIPTHIDRQINLSVREYYFVQVSSKIVFLQHTVTPVSWPPFCGGRRPLPFRSRNSALPKCLVLSPLVLVLCSSSQNSDSGPRGCSFQTLTSPGTPIFMAKLPDGIFPLNETFRNGERFCSQTMSVVD